MFIGNASDHAGHGRGVLTVGSATLNYTGRGDGADVVYVHAVTLHAVTLLTSLKTPTSVSVRGCVGLISCLIFVAIIFIFMAIKFVGL